MVEKSRASEQFQSRRRLASVASRLVSIPAPCKKVLDFSAEITLSVAEGLGMTVAARRVRYEVAARLTSSTGRAKMRHSEREAIPSREP